MDNRKYHINPETGRPNICTATVKNCKYASEGKAPEHYETKTEAREAYESKMSAEKIISHTRGNSKSSIKSLDSSSKEQTQDFYTRKQKSTAGDYTPAEYAEKLRKADPKLVYQSGNCEAVASYLWHTNDKVEEYCYLKTEDDPEFGIHQIVKLKSGYYADSLGVWSEDEIQSYWQKVDTTSKIAVLPNPDNISRDKNTKDYSNGLNTIMEAMIEDHMQKYSNGELEDRTESDKESLNQSTRENHESNVSEINKRENRLMKDLVKSEFYADHSTINSDVIKDYSSTIDEAEKILEEMKNSDFEEYRVEYLENYINNSKINKAFLELELHLKTEKIVKHRIFHSEKARKKIDAKNNAVKAKEENLITNLKALISSNKIPSVKDKYGLEFRNFKNYEKYKNIL